MYISFINSSNNEDIDYYFDGDLNAAANRGSSADVSLAFKVYGQIFLSSDDFKKLDNLQKRGVIRASVKGFAVLTGMKDACAGMHEAMADLYLKMPTFPMKYQGKVPFWSSGLDVMGGELGMIEIKGAVNNLHFHSSDTSTYRKKRYPYPDGGYGSGYMSR